MGALLSILFLTSAPHLPARLQQDYHAGGHLLQRVLTPHRANIFSTQFLPGVQPLCFATCAGDGRVCAFQRRTTHGPFKLVREWRPFHAMAKRIVPARFSGQFLCCAGDGVVALFDINCERSQELLYVPYRLHSIASNGRFFCVAGSSSQILVFDFEDLKRDIHDNKALHPVAVFLVPSTHKSMVTGVAFHADHILVSVSGAAVHRFSMAEGLHTFRAAAQAEAEAKAADAAAADAAADAPPFSQKRARAEEAPAAVSESPPSKTRRTECNSTNAPMILSDQVDDEAGREESRDGDEEMEICEAQDEIVGEEEVVEVHEVVEEEGREEDGEGSDIELPQEDESLDTQRLLHQLSIARRMLNLNSQPRFLRVLPTDYTESNYSCRNVVGVYEGHSNVNTVKSVSFLGPDGEFVCSGSDDGRYFIWELESQHLVAYFEADQDVVNIMEYNPLTATVATSGIDYDVKLWAPTSMSPSSIRDRAEVVRHNQLVHEHYQEQLALASSEEEGCGLQ
eukprot:TRINITY_DN3328_c0_g1_i2.p1 TRINITY_DN3328_c0_g1~~TRINITY_DN3328_c0_g1_i2.p1  ORF type:complete len:510 (-),score=57.01 TRINITY_DN3328_c0_g1_i2:77-1606(-)